MINGRYIYCIAGSIKDKKLETVGIAGQPVFFIEYKDIGAYVSNIPYEDLKTDVKTIETHQQIVEHSRKLGSTLPVKFGVIFKTDDGVKTLLTKHYNEYKSKLAKFNGKDEFGLKVLITSKTSFRDNYSRSKGDNRDGRTGEGTRYFEKLREEETKRYSELRKWDNIRAAIKEELSKHAEENVLLNNDLPQVLLNAAYLVDRKRFHVFRSSVDKIRTNFEPNGLTIHFSGPWAPYSFC